MTSSTSCPEVAASQTACWCGRKAGKPKQSRSKGSSDRGAPGAPRGAKAGATDTASACVMRSLLGAADRVGAARAPALSAADRVDAARAPAVLAAFLAAGAELPASSIDPRLVLAAGLALTSRAG